MKLYFAPRTRSVRPRWLLEELEVPYELVRLDLSDEAARAGLLALNPLGEVPVLVDGETTLFVASAIVLYLADRFPEKGLAPALDSPERGAYLQWLSIAESTLEPLVLEHFWNAQRPESARVDLAAQRVRLDAVLRVIEGRLEGRTYVVGASFTAADLVLASVLHLANTLKLIESEPLREYLMRHCSRAASRRAVLG